MKKITSKSWKMATPSATRAPGLSAIPRSWKALMLTAVEDRATATPTASAAGAPSPRHIPTPPATTVTSATCQPPPTKATRRRCFISATENSIPSVNRRRTIPRSASRPRSSASAPIHFSTPEFAIRTPHRK